MTSQLMRATGAVLLTLGLAPGAMAQVSTNRVAADTDWSLYEYPAICGAEKDGEECRQPNEQPEECWGVSAPKETLNTRDGEPVSVRRGDILLFVTYRPGSAAEVSFTGGYPFAGGSTVEVDIGGTKFDLVTHADSPEWAWSGSPDEDKKIITALKAGASAVVTARSARGTRTQDTFSLLGFSAVLDEAAKRCAS